MNKPQHVLTILGEVRQILAHPGNWIKHANQDGDRFDLYGALHEARNRWTKTLGLTEAFASSHAALELLTKALPEDCAGSLLGYNARPTTTHADICALIDKAVALRCAELDSPEYNPSEAEPAPAPAPAPSPTFESLVDTLLQRSVKIEFVQVGDVHRVWLHHDDEEHTICTYGPTKLEALQEAYNELRAQQLAKVLP